MRIKKKAISILKTKADRLLQLVYVPLNPKCLICGDKTSEMHHFVQKSQSNYLRYNESNLVPLCRRCHSRHHLSGDSSIVTKIIEIKGLDWANKLQEDRHKIFKLNRAFLDYVIASLESRLEE